MAGLIRRFDGGRFAASRFNGQRKGERAPEVITAGTAPQLAAADDTDTPAGAFTAGTYSSTAGTIDSVVATYLVNGSPEASSYDLAAGDTLQVRELVTDSAGNTRTFSTGLVTVALSEALSNTAPPQITGTTAVGNTLSASQGTWAGSAPRTYSYQWTRDGADISGATSSTYTLVAADEGAEIGVEVTADDGFTTVTVGANLAWEAGDNTPPQITGLSAGPQSGDTVPVLFDLDEDATVYFVLVPNGSTAPTQAEILAGEASGGGAPTAGGSVSATSGSGVSAEVTLPDGLDGAYDLYTVPQDAAGNNGEVDSALNIAIDTTVAPTGLTLTYLGEDSSGTGTAGQYTFSGKTLGAGTIIVAVGVESGTTSALLQSLSVGGNAAAIMPGAIFREPNNYQSVAYYAVASSASSGDIVVQLANNATNGVAVRWYLIEGDYAVTDALAADAGGVAEPYKLSLNVDTAEGGIVLASVLTQGNPSHVLNYFEGVTQDGTMAAITPGENFVSGSATDVSAATPRTVRIGQDTDTNQINRISGVAISLEPA